MEATSTVRLLVGLLVTLGAAPALAGPKPAKLDVWDGPFTSIAKATAKDRSPAEELEPDDDTIALPARLPKSLPIDKLVAIRRDAAPCDSCTDEYMQFHLAARTEQGWFISGQLGIHQNRSRCELTKIAVAGSRLAIEYRCEVGRFDWARKELLLLCGVDDTGRPACGRTVLGAQHSVNRGGKSDDATDVVYDTLSCKPSIRGDTVRLVASPPRRSVGDESPHVKRLARCGGPFRFPLDGPFVPGSSEPPPLFDHRGKWRARAR